jgi:hypothetical protein
MKILMYDDDPANLVLVDNDTVVNGNYKVRKLEDGTYSNGCTSRRAVFVKNVVMKSGWTNSDLDRIFDECAKDIKCGFVI